jgi:putative ABC transport system permease protein
MTILADIERKSNDMKRLSALLPRLAGRRASFKIGVVATLAIAVAANVAVLGNLGVMFGKVVPGAGHQNLVEPYFQALDYKAMPASQMGIFRRVYDHLATSLKGRAESATYQMRGSSVQLTDTSHPLRFPYLRVTPSLGTVLGVHVIAGRMLSAADMKTGARPVMLVSEQFANAHFHTAADAVGQSLEMNGVHYRIIGVLPAKLQFPDRSAAHGYRMMGWVPFPPEAARKSANFEFGMHALVRPSKGLSNAGLRRALQNAYSEAQPDYSPSMWNFVDQMHLVPRVAPLAQREFGPLLTQLELLELAALLLLLLVLANLTGLATADALAQRHETATRAALGAGIPRLYLQRLRELIGLGAIGWLLGIGLGWLGSRALAVTIGQAGASVTLSPPVLGLSLAIVFLVCALLSGLGMRRLLKTSELPTDLMSGGHTTGGRGLVRTLRALIALQLAASIVLLVMAGHLQVNVFSLTHDNLGFDLHRRTFISVFVPGNEGDRTEAQFKVWVKKARAFDKRLLARLNNLPGIKSAAILSVAPFSGSSNTSQAGLQPHARKTQRIINVQAISRHIVDALGLQILSGDISPLFHNPAHTVLLDKSAAQQFWPGSTMENDVGRHIYLGGDYLRVVAIVASLHMKAYGSIGGTVFLPFSASSHLGGPQNFIIHSTLPHQLLRKQVARLIKHFNPQAQLEHSLSAAALVASAYAGRARMGRVFGALAVVALFIAAVGLFALLAYRSLVRRPEFAIRGALGATPGRLVGLVAFEAFALWIVGCVIGVPAAYALSLILDSQLPKLGLPAAWVAVAVALGLGITSLIAAAGPARRAARTNPITNLQA